MTQRQAFTSLCRMQSDRHASKPGTELPALGTRYAASAALQLIVDEEVLVYAQPHHRAGAKLTAE